MAIQMKIVTNINDLTNRIALITGASSSLGAAMAQAFVAAGAYIVNADITPDPPAAYSAGESTVESINTEYPASSGSPRAAFIKTNVAESTSGKTAVESTVGKYGRLNVMVNNAGVGAASSTRVDSQDESIFDKGVAVNIKGVWLGTKYADEQFLKEEPHISGDRGWIINSCSIAALVS